MTDDLLAQLRAYVGQQGPVQRARHPVNAPAIADWCDAMGDGNPVYTDEEAAAKSRHGGLVAPPASLDIWDRPGLPAQGKIDGGPLAQTSPTPAGAARGNDPRSKVIGLLEQAGFIGVVAVNSEIEIARYLRPGDVLQNTQTLEDVSEEKQTGLGVGHFLTTRHRYTTTDGEHVGDLLFRILKFKPGTGTTATAPADAKLPLGSKSQPDANPALRPRPAINRDNQVIFDGYRSHELRVPQCMSCSRAYFPPTPRCSECGSFDIGYLICPGTGTLYSHVTVHHPQVNGFRYPLPVGVVELDVPGSDRDSSDGAVRSVRMITDLVGIRPEQMRIGMPLTVDWLDSHPALVEGATDSRGPISLPRFRPATPPRRTDTLRAGDVSTGDALPLWALPVIATQIVAGALATRDFQDVHHDRELAVQKGSADVFFNINTSLGLMQRYVTDWAGPEASVTALRVRLGAPAYPGRVLTFSGSVQSVDSDTGAVVVAVQAVNDLGPHVTGTVELELPQ